MNKLIKANVLELHEEGKTVLEIASLLALDECKVREAIIGRWAEDKAEARRGKKLLDW